MKEKFEDRSHTGNIKLEGRENWVGDKSKVIDDIIEIVEDYSDKSRKLTLRQLYYQLVAADKIPNHDKVYKKISSILSDCRYSGLIDWNAIEDRGRVPYISYYENSINGAIQRTLSSYALNKQKDQPILIEVWTEKDAISGILKSVVAGFTVRLVVNKGYISDSALHNSYQRFAHAMNEGKKVKILYFGDHDPSGLDMIRDIRDRVKLFLYNGYFLGDDTVDKWSIDQEEKFYFKLSDECESYANDEDCYTDNGFDRKLAFIKHHFQVTPIGLTMAQIRQFNPPPNPAKITDPRASWYIKNYGEKSWEVDAIKPEVMEDIVRDSIKENMDMGIYYKILVEEKDDLAKLKTLLTTKDDDLKNEN